MELGTLVLHVQRTPTEVWLQTSREEEPPGDEWVRWALSPSARLEARRAVPDRLVVVSHEYPFNLPPQGTARVFVRIPLHLQLVARGHLEGEVVLYDVPSLVLSDTWWGSFTEGELAYWITTKARAVVTEDLFAPHLALCPFQLANQSNEPLLISRFAVRVPHLSLFLWGEQIWTDEVSVLYEASDEGSEIVFGAAPPPEASDATGLAPPRERPEKGLRAITFDKLRSMSSLGF